MKVRILHMKNYEVDFIESKIIVSKTVLCKFSLCE